MLEKYSHDLKGVGLCGEKPHEPSKLGENRWPDGRLIVLSNPGRAVRPCTAEPN